MNTNPAMLLMAIGLRFVWPLNCWGSDAKRGATENPPLNRIERIDNDSTRGFIMSMDDPAEMDLRAGMDRGYSWSLSLLLNRQKRPYHGLQLSLCCNHAEALWGGQIGLLGNSVRGPLDGFQFSAAGNLVRDSVRGLQMAPIANLAAGNVDGGQGAGVLNLARNVKGAQVAAVFNAARNVDGCQVGLVNVSHDIRNGIPFGLINYSHTGLHSVNVWTDELGFQHVGLLSGSRNFYTYLSAGDEVLTSGRALALGAGMGAQLPFGPWFGAADIGVTDIHYNYDFDGNGPELYKLTLTGGRQLFPYVSVFAGLSFSVFWNQGDGLSFPIGRYQNKWADDVYVWPGVRLGLRLGR
jgi:hypothetical protein